MSCFDYVNSLADLVVGYMGAFGWQWIVVRKWAGNAGLGARQVGNAAGDFQRLTPLSCATKHSLPTTKPSLSHVGSSAHGCGD